jgi:carbonic anhydrase
MNKVIGAVALCASHAKANSLSSMMGSFSGDDSGLALLQTKAHIKKHDPAHWSYEDTDAWATSNPDCAGSGQSPVDLSSTLYDNLVQDTLEAAYLPVAADGLAIQNNGHALQVNGQFGKLTLPDGIYNVLQFHFHCPSEHSVDGALSECEMHIVHQREGSSGTQDLAVVGILFDRIKKAGTSESSGLDLNFLRSLGFGATLPKEGESIPLVDGIDLRRTFGEALAGGYYHYKGSLTTPPCSETVHWYVLRKKAAISKKMIDQFKMMFPSPADNRPVQPLNGREVASDVESVEGEFAEAEEHPHWTYNKPEDWVMEYPDCAGTAQSPINLVGADENEDFESLLPKFDNNAVTGASLKIVNNGHAVQVNGNFGAFNLPDGKYNILQFHFHMPSEHQVNGVNSVGEMHIVTQKEGASGTDDLAVVGILLAEVQAKEQDEQSSIELDFFRRLKFGKLPAAGEEKGLKGGVDLAAAFAPQLGGKYWHYRGSLTTPPCSETVHWYVMQKVAHVTGAMVRNFKELFPPPMDNRPVQQLNSRLITNGAIAVGDDEFN